MELGIIQIKNEIKQNLSIPFPEYLHKKKGFSADAPTYVSAYPIIDKLNNTFGYAGWSWEIEKEWIEESVDKLIKVKYENKKKINLPKEQWYTEHQDPVVHIIGKITVYFERPDGTIHSVVKMAPGAQPIVGGQSEQENAFKSAHTDALKKAATLFGVGLEMYRDDNEQYFFQDLSYINPWTEEEKEKHKEELEYLREYKEETKCTDEEMNGYINDFSNGEYPTIEYLNPDNISNFVKYLKS